MAEDDLELKIEGISDKKIEAIFLILLIGALFFYVNANLYNNSINHEMPYSYFASDGFAYLFLTEHVADSGNQAHHPFYSAGGFNDVIWIHGLVIYSVSSIFANVSGIPAYDALYFVTTLMVVLTALLMYLRAKASR